MIRKILDLLGPNGEHWCKHRMAKDKNGLTATTGSPDAVSWCLLGACRKLRHRFEDMENLLARVGVSNVPRFNDNNDWPTIKATLEEAARVAGE